MSILGFIFYALGVYFVLRIHKEELNRQTDIAYYADVGIMVVFILAARAMDGITDVSTFAYVITIIVALFIGWNLVYILKTLNPYK